MENLLGFILVIFLVIVFVVYSYQVFEENSQKDHSHLDIKFLLKDSDQKIDSNKIIDYVKERKYNFTQKVNVEVKNDEIKILSDKNFKMFQIWNPLHVEYNSKRNLNYEISQESLYNLMTKMKRDLNFEPTIFIQYEDEFHFEICTRTEYKDNNLILKLKTPMNVELTNKSVILYIDSSNTTGCTPPSCSGEGMKQVCSDAWSCPIPF